MSLGQQTYNDLEVVVVVASLVVQRLRGNIMALFYSYVDMLSQFWYVVRKLHRDACDKFAGVANVAAATREEEAGG
jgi:hypothetical protein